MEPVEAETKPIPPEVIKQNVQSILALPNVGTHPMGWRDPQTGLKERYLKKTGTLTGLFGWTTMVLDTLGPSIVGEEVHTINQLVAKTRQILAERSDHLISDKQVLIARKLGALALNILDGKKKEAMDLWAQIKKETQQTTSDE